MTVAAHSQLYPAIDTKGPQAAAAENQAWGGSGIIQVFQALWPQCLWGPQSSHTQSWQPFPVFNPALLLF